MKKGSRIVLQLLALAIVLTGCTGNGGRDNRSTENNSSENNGRESDGVLEQAEVQFAPAHNFSLRSVGGEKIELSHYSGDVVLLNFWATWCGPCREEMPMLVNLQNDLDSRGFQVIGVSVDEEGEAVVESFLEDFPLNYPVVIDEGELAAEYGAQYAVPTTVLIDRAGRVRHRVLGLVEEAELAGIVNELLDES